MTSLQIAKWDASFRIPEISSPLSMVSSNLTEFQAGDTKYDPNRQFEHGGTEWLLDLSRDPRISQLTVPIQTENLRFQYQPPLTPQDIIDGSTRPPNIEGSYAVYHAWRRDNEYKCGKIFHLTIPLLTDDDGKQAWAAYNPNVQELGQLIIAFPTEFLKTAKYPVTIDPTFGKTDIGGTEASSNSSNLRATKQQAPANGTVTQLDHYGKVATGTEPCKGVLYADSAGSPAALLDTSDAATIDTTFGWDSYTNLSQAVVSGTQYHLAWFWTKAATTFYEKYDAGAANQWAYAAPGGYPNPPDPFGVPTGQLAREVSMYATYTAVGAVSIPVAMHHYSHHISKIIRG